MADLKRPVLCLHDTNPCFSSPSLATGSEEVGQGRGVDLGMMAEHLAGIFLELGGRIPCLHIAGNEYIKETCGVPVLRWTLEQRTSEKRQTQTHTQSGGLDTAVRTMLIFLAVSFLSQGLSFP